MHIWCLGNNYTLSLDKEAILMGILNITPDSFSDGGENFSSHTAINRTEIMIEEGAKIIDIGGESTRPEAHKIDSEIEQQRILPILQELIKTHSETIFSIDTYNASTAQKALEQGAHIINDIWGLQYDPAMAEIIAHYGAGVIIMHNSRDRDCLADPIEDQRYFFEKSLNIAKKANIKESQIALDPGFGFGKNYETNIEIMKKAHQLKQFGFPLVAATSRKRFLGTLTDCPDPKARDYATAFSSILLYQSGFSIFRVHNVKINHGALLMANMFSPQ